MAHIEMRTPRAGFVYTKHTRMLFAPKFTATRKVEDRDSTDLVISAAQGHPEPTTGDVGEVRRTLTKQYPDCVLFVETTEGLVPIYEPGT